ncbi:MAG TPA: lipoprotein [Janthinobacterium sp.]|nr:lipoprotein [Janthinobacterium sp.]
MKSSLAFYIGISILLSGALAGCGQTGPLYLPKLPPKTAPAKTPGATTPEVSPAPAAAADGGDPSVTPAPALPPVLPKQ